MIQSFLKDDIGIDVDDGLAKIMDSNDIKTDTETIESASKDLKRKLILQWIAKEITMGIVSNK